MVDSSNPQNCIACGGAIRILSNFGVQALTNYFPTNVGEIVRVHPLILGTCTVCATVQLCNPCPEEMLRPPRPMRYNEPEGHLDTLVDEVVSLPGVSRHSRFCGLTYKESTTLERLSRLGFHDLTTLSPRDDFQITDESAGLETIQARLTSEVADMLVARHGTFDVVFVRHLLEHVHHLTGFLPAVKCLTTPAGYVIFEVPDCTTMFDVLDYSFLWEEHISYFTPATLASTLRNHGLNPCRVLTYPYAFENSLVAITRRDSPPLQPTHERPDVPSGEHRLADRYAASFPRIRELWREKLTALKRQGPVAVLGAGHLAVTFINLLGLEGMIDCVCDDASDKVDLWIPGTQLQISSTDVLLQHPFSVCLMAVAPDSEPRVLARHQEFINRGGRFASIFAASDYAMKLDATIKRESHES